MLNGLTVELSLYLLWENQSTSKYQSTSKFGEKLSSKLISQEKVLTTHTSPNCNPLRNLQKSTMLPHQLNPDTSPNDIRQALNLVNMAILTFAVDNISGRNGDLLITCNNWDDILKLNCKLQFLDTICKMRRIKNFSYLFRNRKERTSKPFFKGNWIHYLELQMFLFEICVHRNSNCIASKWYTLAFWNQSLFFIELKIFHLFPLFV